VIHIAAKSPLLHVNGKRSLVIGDRLCYLASLGCEGPGVGVSGGARVLHEQSQIKQARQERRDLALMGNADSGGDLSFLGEARQ
jgi:hypothetical protein